MAPYRLAHPPALSQKQHSNCTQRYRPLRWPRAAWPHAKLPQPSLLGRFCRLRGKRSLRRWSCQVPAQEGNIPCLQIRLLKGVHRLADMFVRKDSQAAVTNQIRRQGTCRNGFRHSTAHTHTTYGLRGRPEGKPGHAALTADPLMFPI